MPNTSASCVLACVGDRGSTWDVTCVLALCDCHPPRPHIQSRALLEPFKERTPFETRPAGKNKQMVYAPPESVRGLRERMHGYRVIATDVCLTPVCLRVPLCFDALCPGRCGRRKQSTSTC